jgi:transcriptional regulator with XRE-family HTH domain
MEISAQIQQLRDIVQALSLSNADIARISGKSTGTVSQVLSGKYRGRAEVIGEMLASLEAHKVRVWRYS